MRASKHPLAYRLYRHDTGEMFYPDDLEAKGMSISPTGLPMFRGEPMLNSTLSWFSGQLDHHKKPLFEGDICKIGVVNEFGSLSEHYACMRYNHATHQFILEFPSAIKGMQYETRSCELVGDEFRNPELLSKVNGTNPQN